MLAIVSVGLAYVLISGLNAWSMKLDRERQTWEALALAKEALIGYAVTYGDVHGGEVHGYLPCPDMSGTGVGGEGVAEGSCPASPTKDASALGRLPWRTLGLRALRDDAGECLWYAVAGTYKYNPKTDLMNWDTNGLFEVMRSDGVSFLAGSQPTNRAVAVIFAPGAPLTNAQKSGRAIAAASTPVCGGNYTASNYLDNDTLHGINNGTISTAANAVIRFVVGIVKDGSDNKLVNDRVIVITKDEIFDAIMRRADFKNSATNPLLLMAKKTAECLANYGKRNSAGPGDKRIPWPADVSLADFGTDSSYDDRSDRLYGRAPYSVGSSDSDSDNLISPPYYQLLNTGANCPLVSWSTYYPWWTNWKDHLFYVVASAYRPEAGTSQACPTCIAVNGSGQYAGVVIFAGKRLSTQSRNSPTEKQCFTNYLDSQNNANFTLSGAMSGCINDGRTQDASVNVNTNFQSGPETGTFNDVLFCIGTDLTVVPC
ncbi:MAG TPA: hypothetical protein VLC55_06485 [Burkholderiales bacterium]|nr:hypothetical protein [Burkholderiales bacterium]